MLPRVRQRARNFPSTAWLPLRDSDRLSRIVERKARRSIRSGREATKRSVSRSWGGRHLVARAAELSPVGIPIVRIGRYVHVQLTLVWRDLEWMGPCLINRSPGPAPDSAREFSEARRGSVDRDALAARD